MPGLGRVSATVITTTRPRTMEEARQRWRLSPEEEAVVAEAALQMGAMQDWQCHRPSMKGRKLKRGSRRRTCPMPRPADHIRKRVGSFRDEIRLLNATVDVARIRGLFVSNSYNKTDWQRRMEKKGNKEERCRS